jgi:dCTP deaminase
MSRGIYTHVEIDELLANRAVTAALPIAPDQVQPTSLDLRAGPRAFRIRAGFLPTRHSVKERLADLALFEIDLEGGAVFEPGHIYLVPLEEELALPPGVCARANPKSSIGRVDLFTRVICDRAARFDDIPDGYRGKLYVEVVPSSFPVRLRRGSRLNQLRFFAEDSMLSDAEHRAAHAAEPLVLDRDGRVFDPGDLNVDGGLNLGLSLVPESSDGIIGYRAKRFTGVVDLDRPRAHDAAEFFEPILARADGRLVLEPEEFYIFASREKIRVPPQYAAEMLAYDVGIGELRTNYAGFFDAGFGYGEAGEILGTPGVLEVRAHDVPFVVEDGQVFFRLVYHRTTQRCGRVYGASGSTSNYARQGLTLAKYFRT